MPIFRLLLIGLVSFQKALGSLGLTQNELWKAHQSGRGDSESTLRVSRMSLLW